MAYYYANEAEQFVFYRIPRVLFTGHRYKSMSTDAKVLYGLLLDRVGLSVKNNWIDEQGRVYIIFPRKDAQELLNYGNQKVAKLFKELVKYDLTEEKTQGLNLPNIIYVKKFIEEKSLKTLAAQWTCENNTPGDVKITSQEMLKSHASNTNISNTDINNTTTTDSNRNQDTMIDQETKSKRTVVVVDKYSEESISQIKETAKAEDVSLTEKNIQELLDLANKDVKQVTNGILAAAEYAKRTDVRNMWGLIKQAVKDGKMPTLGQSAHLDGIRKKKHKYRDVYLS